MILAASQRSQSAENARSLDSDITVQFCSKLTDERRRAFGSAALEQPADEGAPDDDAIGMCGGLTSLGGECVYFADAFGVAGAAHQPAGRLSLRYAWLSAYWGSLPLEGGIEAAYRADIAAAADPQAELTAIETRLNALRSPFRSAEKFWVEEIIDPRRTRSLLCDFARLAEPLRVPGRAQFSIRP